MNPESNTVLHWPLIASRPAGHYRIFSVRGDIKRHPRTGRLHEFYSIESVNWVSVVAVTPANELVMVEQYRHGSNTVELEVPGGMMDVHETDPIVAGSRELREETGYTGESARIIGEIFPNAAVMTNKCYTLLVENCRQTHATEFDPGEDLVTRLVPIVELPGLVACGRIRHAMVVVALYHFHLHSALKVPRRE